MPTKLTRFFLQIVITLILFITCSSQSAYAGIKWWSSSNVIVAASQPCRDGIELFAVPVYHEWRFPGGGFYIHHYDPISKTIGPTIYSSGPNERQFHRRPRTDIVYGSEGFYGYDFASYSLLPNQYLYVYPSLSNSGLEYGAPDFIRSVEDCYFQLTANQHLPNSFESYPTIFWPLLTGLNYRLMSLPQNGLLEINGKKVNNEDEITQLEIDTGQFQYKHGGSSIAQDRFQLRIEGITRASINKDSIQGNAGSWEANLSRDGDLVAFSSLATNLSISPDDTQITTTNVYSDVYVHYLWSGITKYVWGFGCGSASSPTVGHDSYAIVVAFDQQIAPTGTDPNCIDIFSSAKSIVVATGMSLVAGDRGGQELMSEPWYYSLSPSGESKHSALTGFSSSDGSYRYYASTLFESDSPDLIEHDTNGFRDIFSTSRAFTGSDETPAKLESVTYAGDQANGNSYAPTGSYSFIAYESDATNMLPVSQQKTFRDIFTKVEITEVLISNVSISIDGGEADGNSYNPAVVGSGDSLRLMVAFESDATNLVAEADALGYRDIFVRDLINQKTIRISNNIDGKEANGNSYRPKLAAGGRLVVFESEATNLVSPTEPNPNYRDIYLYDRDTDNNGIFDEVGFGKTKTIRITSRPDGRPANGNSFRPDIAQCGIEQACYVAFDSEANDLVPNDTNGVSDVFVYYMGPSKTYTVNLATIAVTATVASASVDCGEDQSIAASIGSTVNYCLFVKNTGTIAFDQLRINSNGVSVTLPITLMPGDQITITPKLLLQFQQPAVLGPLSATNDITRNFTIFADDGHFTGQQQSSAYVNVLIPSFTFTGTVKFSSPNCLTSSSTLTVTEQVIASNNQPVIYFCFAVRNNGEVPFLTHRLFNENQNLLVKEFPYRLDVGESFTTLDLGIVVSATVTKTLTYTFTWTSLGTTQSISTNQVTPISRSFMMTTVRDLDQDGIADEVDDSDNDGLTDSVEGIQDRNHNSIPDYRDPLELNVEQKIFLPLIGR